MKFQLVVLIEALDHQKKNSISITKANTKLSLDYNTDNSYLFVNGKEIFKFRTNNKKFNFRTHFCLGGISNGFTNTESKEVSLYGNAFDFSVDYNSFDKSVILNIQKYLMIENNIE